MKKRILCLVLALAMLLPLCPAALAEDGTSDNFTRSRTYEDGMFTDVPDSAWYAEHVADAYELGLMNGTSDTTFNPSGNITLREAITVAAQICSIYYGETIPDSGDGTWYQKYIDYAVEKGIITSSQFSNTGKAATRAEFAGILAKALPESELEAIRTIKSIPDVTEKSSYGAAIYQLYRAGIISGSDEFGTFNPQSSIRRSEVSVIVSAMADPSLRSTTELKVKPAEYPTAANGYQTPYNFSNTSIFVTYGMDGETKYYHYTATYNGVANCAVGITLYTPAGGVKFESDDGYDDVYLPGNMPVLVTGYTEDGYYTVAGYRAGVKLCPKKYLTATKPSHVLTYAEYLSLKPSSWTSPHGYIYTTYSYEGMTPFYPWVGEYVRSHCASLDAYRTWYNRNVNWLAETTEQAKKNIEEKVRDTYIMSTSYDPVDQYVFPSVTCSEIGGQDMDNVISLVKLVIDYKKGYKLNSAYNSLLENPDISNYYGCRISIGRVRNMTQDQAIEVNEAVLDYAAEIHMYDLFCGGEEPPFSLSVTTSGGEVVDSSAYQVNLGFK